MKNPEKLMEMAKQNWIYANQHHTRKKFLEKYQEEIHDILQ
jgi:hypothetical protein